MNVEGIIEKRSTFIVWRSRKRTTGRIGSLLEDVGLDRTHLGRYPHEFSGGRRQRMALRALAVQPKLIVCDEPVSALDVSVQAQIVNLLRDSANHGIAYLFIAHDLAVVEHQSANAGDAGKIVESGPASRLQLTQASLHPGPDLRCAVVDPESKRRRIVLPGEPPSPISPPSGCPFHPRCPIAEARCRTEMPALREVGDGHQAACHLA